MAAFLYSSIRRTPGGSPDILATYPNHRARLQSSRVESGVKATEVPKRNGPAKFVACACAGRTYRGASFERPTRSRIRAKRNSGVCGSSYNACDAKHEMRSFPPDLGSL